MESGQTFLRFFKTKKDKLVIQVLRETFFSSSGMKFIAFLSLTFNFDIKLQYTKNMFTQQNP